jgi:hypothetical protein
MGFRKIASRYEGIMLFSRGFLDIVCFLMCWKKVQEAF